MRDWLAFRRKEPEDAEQYGIMGMRWGIRRTDAQIAKDTVKRKSEGEKVTDTQKAKEATSAVKTSHGEETAAQKYARLTGEAKGGGATNWSEADLKFYNSRTEALAKVNKMFETQPGWLSTTSKRVLQNAAQRMMQDVANGVANKYITSKLLDSINDNSAAVKAESKTPIDYVGRHRAKKK